MAVRRPSAGVLLVTISVVSLAVLLAVRLLDGRRDRHDTTLLSLVHLDDLLGRDDGDTSSLQAGASAVRAADLRYTRTQISERLQYLGRLGLDTARLRTLDQAFATYHASADRALAAPGPGAREGLTDQVTHLRAAIETDSNREKAAFATYDVALDSLTVAFLVTSAAAGAFGAAAWWIRGRQFRSRTPEP